MALHLAARHGHSLIGSFSIRITVNACVGPSPNDDMIGSEDMEHNSRVMAAMNTMIKFDLEALRAADRGE